MTEYQLPAPEATYYDEEEGMDFTVGYTESQMREAYAQGREDMKAECIRVCESRITPNTGSLAVLMGAAKEIGELK